MKPKRLGLIVNPVAGLGGRVGLKGSDGLYIQKRAREFGAKPRCQERTVDALQRLQPLKEDLHILTYPGEMGADAALASGFQVHCLGSIRPGKTTAEDTRAAACEILRGQADLLLFAGGDGTARDICQAVADQLPVLGIPAGVKIHSAAFATNPINAGELSALYLTGKVSRLRDAEVLDIDEDAYRQGAMATKLYGYLKTPQKASLVQNLKLASNPSESAAVHTIARFVVDRMESDCLYILGPGTTTRAIAQQLDLDKTLLGVDILFQRQLQASDANEERLLQGLRGWPAKIIVSPIGGQGYLFGRGNQQISPSVISLVGKQNIIVISTEDKIHALHGAPLLVDTGSRRLDERLTGYVRVITGYDEQIFYKVAC